MLTLFICICVLIFPLNLGINAAFLKEEKKAFFGIYLFGVIKIVGGYAEKITEGFAVHLSDKKVVIINYKAMLGAKDRIKPFMDYHFTKIKIVIESGSENNLITPVSIAFISEYIMSFIERYYSFKKPYLVIDCGFNVYDGKNKLNLFIRLNVVFNLIMIISSIIKIITEKTIYAIRQRKNKN